MMRREMKWAVILTVIFGIGKTAHGQVVLNEISNANYSHLDDQGEMHDWVELYNASGTDVNLSDYSLSDDSLHLNMWQFDNTVLPAGDYLLVYASGKNAGIHTNFGIKREGESVYLSKHGNVIDFFHLQMLEANQSWGRCSDGGSQWGVKTDPSPGWSNSGGSCFDGYEPDAEFSIESGFYSGSQVLNITSPSSTGEVRFTLTGDFPTTSDAIFNNPITINKTTVVTARIFSNGNKLPGKIIKKTIFIDEGKLDLPVISISLNPDDLWDDNTGIYVNYSQDWEKTGHIEFFDKHKQIGFSLLTGIKIQGGYSRDKPQKSFRILSRGEYGTSWIDYPLISEIPHIASYKRFNIRNGGSDFNYTRFRDAFIQRVLKDSPIDKMAYEPAVVFLNGEYWGMYGLREQQNSKYILSHYGIPEDEVDLLYHRGSKVRPSAGAVDEFYRMYDYVAKANPGTDEFLRKSGELIDLEIYADYFITEIYWSNRDWLDHTAGSNNIRLWRQRVPEGKWRYMFWDLDMGSGIYGTGATDNNLAIVRNPDEANVHSDIFRNLLANTEFRNYFVNRYADLMNTAFQYKNLRSIAYAMRDSMDSSIPRHKERWGGTYEEWLDDIDQMLNWHLIRITHARDHIQQEFALNGQVNITLSTDPPEAGRIQINTVMPDSLPWKGVYYDGVPVRITAIPNPGYEFQHWSSGFVLDENKEQKTIEMNVNVHDKFVAHFSGQAAQPEITFSEINYHPDKAFDGGDWVELHNYGSSPLDLSHWVFRNGNDLAAFKIPFGTVIMPGQYLVLVEDTLNFSSLYTEVGNYIGGFKLGLKNSGDMLRLFDHQNKVILSMTYGDSKPWPKLADGKGRTLELIKPGADLNHYSSWFAGCYGGSPGIAFTSDCQIVNTLETTPDAVSMLVFPNPSDGRFRVNITGTNDAGNEWQYQLYDISGRMVKSGNYLSGNTFEIDLSAAVPGIYYLRFRDNEGKATGKKIMLK